MTMRHAFSPRPLVAAAAIAAACVATASRAESPLPPTPDWRHGWTEVDGRYFKYDKAKDTLSCYAAGAGVQAGAACSTTSPDAEGALLPVNRTCGADAKANGPDADACERAHAVLAARWFNYEALGWQVRLAKSLAGHAMCESYNGKDCHWNSTGDEPERRHLLQPLTCGSRHAADWGITGYDTAGHWCGSPEIVSKTAAIDGLTPGAPRTVSIPEWNAAEEPGWIVRTTVPEDNVLEFRSWMRVRNPQEFFGSTGVGLRVGGAGSGPRATIDGREFGNLVPKTPMPPYGKVTIALRVSDDGNTCFHQDDGDVPDILGRAPIGDTFMLANHHHEPAFHALRSGDPGARLTFDGTAGVTISEVIGLRNRDKPTDMSWTDFHASPSLKASRWRCPGSPYDRKPT